MGAHASHRRRVWARRGLPANAAKPPTTSSRALSVQRVTGPLHVHPGDQSLQVRLRCFSFDVINELPAASAATLTHRQCFVIPAREQSCRGSCHRPCLTHKPRTSARAFGSVCTEWGPEGLLATFKGAPCQRPPGRPALEMTVLWETEALACPGFSTGCEEGGKLFPKSLWYLAARPPGPRRQL